MSRTHTVQRTSYNFLERMIDSAGAISAGLGLAPTDLDRSRMMTEARRKTGLENFGDPRFIEGLDRAIAASDGRFSHFGTLLWRAMLAEALINKLRLEDYLERTPEVLDVEVKRPVFVLGFPRTGTTLIQNLLSLPESRRPLEFWELYSPVPANDDLATDRMQRQKRLQRVLTATDWFVPEMQQMHAVSPTSPEEDWYLFVDVFHCLNFDLVYGLEPYGRWLTTDADMVWAYRQYKRMLQLLLYLNPAEQLVLKCPEHLWFIDALLEVFPDACIVQTHRDPLSSVASYCSMVSLHERTYTGGIRPARLGDRIVDRFQHGVARAHEARSRHPSNQFFDVRFRDLVEDPRTIIENIESHFDLEPASHDSIDRWLNKRRSDKRGAHRYHHNRFGLLPTEVYDQFAWYTDTYGVNTRDPRNRNPEPTTTEAVA